MALFCRFRLVCSFSFVLMSQIATAEVSFLEKIGSEKIEIIGNSNEWKKILFYVPAWGRGELSIVDDPKFFADAAGRTQPQDELAATIKAFTEGMNSSRQQALCKYPARRKFLEKALNTRFEDPEPDNSSDVCKRNKIFTERVKAENVSLIFSSYFAGSPASLFGHTLLKFKKANPEATVVPEAAGTDAAAPADANKDGNAEGDSPDTKDTAKGKASPAAGEKISSIHDLVIRQADSDSENSLLDYGVNHAAYPSTQNPILYPIFGLTGMFPGMVSMMPYYVKVQEYNNAESRDLWEYDLNFTADEVSSMLLSVFELSTSRIDYYYFDDNCSYLMIALLDAGRPSLNLVSKFRSWVIPSDTVRVVSGTPSLVKQIKFRPSNVRKYLNLERTLTDKERKAFNTLMFSQKVEEKKVKVSRHAKNKVVTYYKVNTGALRGLNPAEQTHVLDTALEYIDSTEKLAGSQSPQKWKNERELLLKRRAELGTVSKPNIVPVPVTEAPHKSYPPTRVSLGVVNSISPEKFINTGLLFGWRPALHTLDNPVTGMGADLGIAFLNTELLLQGKSLSLRELMFISIESMQPPRPNVSSLSWAFDLAYRQRCFSGCRQIYAKIEVGYVYPAGAPDDRLALRGAVKVGDDQAGALFIEPTINAVANFPLSLNSRWVSRLAAGGTASLWKGLGFIFDASTTYVYRPAEPWEIQAGAELLNKELQIMARTHYYF